MTTTTCDLTADWNKCPDCQRLKRAVDEAEADTRFASEDLDRAWADYRTDASEGRACIATPRQRAWSSYLDDLEREQSLASSHWKEAIDTWAASINEHHRRYEARQQEAEDGKGVAADAATGVNENTDTDDAMPCTCAMCQAEDGEPTETEDQLARELFGNIWYCDDHKIELPRIFSERDHCDPDDGEREERRRAALTSIAAYMGVPVDSVHLICSGTFGYEEDGQ